MDRLPGREFMWQMEVREDEDKVLCLPVKDPWHATDEYLIIRATRGNGNDGGRIALVLSDTPHYDIDAAVSVEMLMHSPQADGDDGA